MKQQIEDILKSGDSSLYASGGNTKGKTLEEELKTVKKNSRKNKHQPTYFIDNADRDLSKKMRLLLKS